MTNIRHGNIDDNHMCWSTLSILDVTFLEFTYISIFYWFLKDVCILFIPFHYYLDFIANVCLDVKFVMLRKNFVILRVSGYYL